MHQTSTVCWSVSLDLTAQAVRSQITDLHTNRTPCKAQSRTLHNNAISDPLFCTMDEVYFKNLLYSSRGDSLVTLSGFCTCGVYTRQFTHNLTYIYAQKTGRYKSLNMHQSMKLNQTNTHNYVPSLIKTC